MIAVYTHGRLSGGETDAHRPAYMVPTQHCPASLCVMNEEAQNPVGRPAADSVSFCLFTVWYCSCCVGERGVCKGGRA